MQAVDAPSMHEYVWRTVGKTVLPRTSVRLLYLRSIHGWNFRFQRCTTMVTPSLTALESTTDTFTLITGFVAVLTFAVLPVTVLTGNQSFCRVSVNTTSAPSATCLCRLPQPPARNWPSMYSFFGQKWYGLLSFWALLWLRARML